jgi:hypothetical protein
VVAAVVVEAAAAVVEAVAAVVAVAVVVVVEAVEAVEAAAVVAIPRPLTGRRLLEHPIVARRLATCPQRASHARRFRHRLGDRPVTEGHADLQR